MSSCSSSCLNWVSCSCYSTDVSLTKSRSLMLWTFIHQALKASSDFIINSVTLHQAPQIATALQGLPRKQTLPFSSAESSKPTLKYSSFHADSTSLEVEPLKKSEQSFSALLENTILYISSYWDCMIPALHHKKLVSRHPVHNNSFPHCFSQKMQVLGCYCAT